MMAAGRALLDRHGLTEWRFDIRNLRRHKPGLDEDNEDLWGGCIPEQRLIVVHESVGRQFRQVVLHEIAHALTGEGGHTKEWIEKARKIGCTAKRLSGYS